MQAKRRSHNRLGFAVQLTSVRFLGRFIPDPPLAPAEVAENVAGQLEIADASCLKLYGGRDDTARMHAGEIQEAGGWRDFAEVHDELVGWLDARPMGSHATWTRTPPPLPTLPGGHGSAADVCSRARISSREGVARACSSPHRPTPTSPSTGTSPSTMHPSYSARALGH